MHQGAAGMHDGPAAGIASTMAVVTWKNRVFHLRRGQTAAIGAFSELPAGVDASPMDRPMPGACLTGTRRAGL